MSCNALPLAFTSRFAFSSGNQFDFRWRVDFISNLSFRRNHGVVFCEILIVVEGWEEAVVGQDYLLK